MLEVAQLNALRELSKKIPEALGRIESTVRWSCEQVVWRIEQQTDVMRGIDDSLKTPAQTKANEWRIMADTLRERGVLNEACSFYEKSVAENPLDYRTYVGLATVHIQTGSHEQALKVLEGSLPHAPRGETGEITDWRSHSLRTIAHIYHCLGNHDRELEALREALKYSPDYRACRYDHAVAAMECKCDEESIASLSTLLHQEDFHQSETYFELTRRHRVFTNNTPKVKPTLTKALHHWSDHLVNSPLAVLADKLSKISKDFRNFSESIQPAVRREMSLAFDKYEASIGSAIKRVRHIKSTTDIHEITKVWRAATSIRSLAEEVWALTDRLPRLKDEIHKAQRIRESETKAKIIAVSVFLLFF